MGIGRIVSDRTGKDSAYVTYNYIKQVGVPAIANTKAEDEKYNNITAQEAGFYFEAKFLQYLNEELKKIDQDITFSEPLNKNQSRAINNFEGGIVKNQKELEEVINLAEQVRRGARGLAINVAKQIKQTIKESENKDIIISNIASAGDISERVSGDIKIKIGGMELIIEMKWQSSSTANTRLFSQTSDETLFKGAFGNFAMSYKDGEYWQGLYKEDAWTTNLSKIVLPAFLENYEVPGGQELLQYLASKSFGTLGQKKKGSVKLIAHANYYGFTLTDMESVGKALAGAKFGLNPNMRYSSEAVIFSVNGKEVATFGIDKYRNQRSLQKERESKVNPKTGKKLYSAPKQDSFSFALYIVQKLVSEWS